jgi:hypothetical protein
MNGAGAGATPDSRQCDSRPPVGRRRVSALCGAIAVFTAAAIAGDVLSPALLERQPLLLLMLNSRTIFLIAVARRIPFAVFVLVATARLCAADPFHFLLGRSVDATASPKTSRLRRLARRLPSATSPLWLTVVALSPTAKTMVIAGAARVPARGVAAANLLGTVGRVVLIWTAGRSLPSVGDSVGRYAPWFGVPCGLLAIALLALRFRRSARLPSRRQRRALLVPAPA